jgi:hypothetical protein
MAKPTDPIADDSANRLFVGNWKSRVFSLKPYVAISVRPRQSGPSATGPTMRLTPSDARRLAITLLTLAEEVE